MLRLPKMQLCKRIVVLIGAVLLITPTDSKAWLPNPTLWRSFLTLFAGHTGGPRDEDGTGVASFYAPTDMTMDSSGNMYVCDSGNATIRKISPAGMVSILAGSTGTTGALDGL